MATYSDNVSRFPLSERFGIGVAKGLRPSGMAQSRRRKRPTHMQRRKIIKTTLGDLIAAVTDEVAAFTRHSAGSYMVSYIVSDLLSRQRVRRRERLKRAAGRYPGSFCRVC